MMSKELKACPFCGGRAKIYDNAYHVFVNTYVQIRCTKCGVRTMEYRGQDWDDTHMLAIEAWNRRAGEQNK